MTKITLLGGLRRAGRFATGARVALVTLVGGMDLDLREAEIPPGGLTITKVSLIGGVHVVVPPGAQVQVRAFRILGGKRIEGGTGAAAGTPLVRVRSFGLIGGVRVG